MKTQFFSNCTTIEDVKTTYKQLCKQNHPDLGGSVEVMQQINVEYAFVIKAIASGMGLSSEDQEKTILESEAYANAINNIANLPGITIEVVGTWVWVTGNTYPVKENLSAAGFHFARKKVAWYFHTDDYKSKSSGKSLDEIKTKYGSKVVNSSGKYLRN